MLLFESLSALHLQLALFFLAKFLQSQGLSLVFLILQPHLFELLSLRQESSLSLSFLFLRGLSSKASLSLSFTLLVEVPGLQKLISLAFLKVSIVVQHLGHSLHIRMDLLSRLGLDEFLDLARILEVGVLGEEAEIRNQYGW